MRDGTRMGVSGRQSRGRTGSRKSAPGFLRRRLIEPLVTPTLRINLLGDFLLLYGDKPVTGVNTARLQSLLAYLALHRHAPQPRHHLAFLMWPDSSEAQAQSNLRNLIHLLRRAFPDIGLYLSIDGRAFQWRSDASISMDVAEFESALKRAGSDGPGPGVDDGRPAADDGGTDSAQHTSIVDSHAPDPRSALQEAVDLYRGDLLPGCYDEWILPERERLRQGFLDALQRLVLLLESERNYAGAISYAQRLLRHDPLREQSYRHLMRLHAAHGDRAGAMRVYRNCVMVLQRELGVEPGPATRKAYEDLAAEPVPPQGPAITRRRNNLPAETTVFIGRERELAAAIAMIRRPGVRLATLTGTAGTGKTRLGLQVAADLAGDFSDGVYFVSLASISDPGQVGSAIAQALEVREVPGRSLLDGLSGYLENREVLLLLDNFEHVASAAPVVSALLANCPSLKVLVTSRAALRLRGEKELPVPPMSLPGPDHVPWPEELAQYEAIALFIERALDVKPDFTLTGKNAGDVAEICRRLEGLPLAIELAAARVKVLPPEAILARLESRLKLLVGGALDLPPRQRALRNAIAWSYNLLTSEEQTLFRRLAVFVGGCTLGAVEAVAGGGGVGPAADDGRGLVRTTDVRDGGADVLEGMSALVDKSLLRRSESELPGETHEASLAFLLAPRFSMLETICEYAQEQLEQSGEAAAIQRAHARFFLYLAEAAEPEVVGPRQITWLQVLESEHDNLRAALRWALETGQEAEIALRMCAALGRFWDRHGHLAEGRRWSRSALSLQGARERTAHRARALGTEGFLAIRQGDAAAARPLLEESLAIFMELDDRAGIAQASNRLGLLAAEQADHVRARELHEGSLAIYRDLGDTWGIANSLQSLGFIAYSSAEVDRASSILEESLALWREVGDKWGIASSLRLMGNVADDRQDFERSRRLYYECLAIYREMGNKWGVAWTMHDLGDIAWRFEAYDEAEALHRETLAIFGELGDKTGTAMSLHRLGRIAHGREQYEAAAAFYRQSLALSRDLGNRPVMAFSIGGIAEIAAAYGQPRLAARLFGAAQAVLDTISSTLESAGVAKRLPATRALLGESEWATEWAAGQALSLEEAITEALGVRNVEE